MTTLMSAIRKNNMTKFNALVQNASSEHVDSSLLLATRDDYDVFVPTLLLHPNLTQKGFESGFGSAIMNRKRQLLQLYLQNAHMTSDLIIDQLVS